MNSKDLSASLRLAAADATLWESCYAEKPYLFIKNERIFPVFLKCRLLVTIISSSTNLSHKSNILKTKDRKCFPLITLYLFIILNYKGNTYLLVGSRVSYNEGRSDV